MRFKGDSLNWDSKGRRVRTRTYPNMQISGLLCGGRGEKLLSLKKVDPTLGMAVFDGHFRPVILLAVEGQRLCGARAQF